MLFPIAAILEVYLSLELEMNFGMGTVFGFQDFPINGYSNYYVLDDYL